MLRDSWFIKKADWFKKRFMEIGCSLPLKPFKTYKAYLAWNKKYWDCYTKMEQSPEFLEAKQRITGNKEVMSPEEFYAFEDFREEFLPPMYGLVFDEILEHFHINPEDKGFHDFLEFHFFFGQEEYYTSPFSIKWIRNSKTNEMEMFLRIYGHTKKEDIMRHWDWVSADQKYIKDFIGKNKVWKTFDRDIEVYGAYKKLKENDAKRRQSIVALDKDIWATLHQKYTDLTVESIRKIISRTAKRLGEI
jgi:hypothetical protein